MKLESRTQIIVAIVLLLLPVFYVGSYLALVAPSGIEVEYNPTSDRSGNRWTIEAHYRAGAHKGSWVFWPLEQIDRKVRPGEWQSRAREQVKQLESQIKFN